MADGDAVPDMSVVLRASVVDDVLAAAAAADGTPQHSIDAHTDSFPPAGRPVVCFRTV